MEQYKYFDLHTQTIAHGPYPETPLLVSETVESAYQRGINIGLSDHYPLPPGFIDPTVDHDCSMPRILYFGNYRSQINEVVQNEQRIKVLKAAEFDWLRSYQEWSKNEVLDYPFDYTIGSVHFVPDIKGNYHIIDYTEKVFRQTVDTFGGIRNLVEAYYREISAMATSGIPFNIVGHIDLIKKYNADQAYFSEDEDWYRDAVTQALKSISNTPMAIEINTAGWYKKCEAQYPSLWILKEAKRLGIPITLGSDGHRPEEIGRDLDKAIVAAKEAGYTSVVYFENRHMKEITL